MSRRLICRILLIAVVVGILGFTDTVFAQGRSEEALEHVIAVQERNTERFMAREGVVGTAVGLDKNGRHVVMIMLEESGIPNVPDNLEGIPVQRVVTGTIYARDVYPGLFNRPVPIGVSTGNAGECSSGTIGCRVIDGSGYVYALSNNHVYALENTALLGSEVLQPGLVDTGCVYNPDNVIGNLSDYVSIRFHPRAKNKVDAAIAITTADLVGTATPGGEYTPSATTAAAYVGQPVKKCGRTTGLTYGTVDGINATVRIQYSSGIAQFVEQIVIIPGTFSDSGDSGSLIVTDDTACNPVGLLFAGSSSITVANPIDYVLDAFNVTVDDGTGGSAENQPPVADAGENKTVSDENGDGYETVTLDGSGSYDSDGTIDSYEWKEGTTILGTAASITESFAVGVHTVTLTVTDDGGLKDTDNVTITVTEPGGEMAMHVFNIVMSLSTRSAGPNTFARAFATVTIVDTEGSPVEGATVYGSWSGAASGSYYGITNSTGNITFESDNVKNPSGEFTFTVTNVVKDGWTYDSAANVETSDSI